MYMDPCAEAREVCSTPRRTMLPSTPSYRKALPALRLSQRVDILMTDIQCR